MPWASCPKEAPASVTRASMHGSISSARKVFSSHPGGPVPRQVTRSRTGPTTRPRLHSWLSACNMSRSPPGHGCRAAAWGFADAIRRTSMRSGSIAATPTSCRAARAGPRLTRRLRRTDRSGSRTCRSRRRQGSDERLPHLARPRVPRDERGDHSVPVECPARRHRDR